MSKGKITIDLEIEVYPDGEVCVYDNTGETLGRMLPKHVLKSMTDNLRNCDWMTLEDMKKFSVKLQKTINDYECGR